MTHNQALLTTILGNAIQLQRRNVYGNQLVYPNCERSRMLAQMIGAKTFSGSQVELIRDLFIPLGVAVNVTESAS